MYERITGENPYKVPMRIYPALHYTMGGLWVDYNLMSTIPGLFVVGEANFSDHGANRLGASALMQGLADGYFITPLHARRLPGRTRQAPVEVSHRRVRAPREAEVDDADASGCCRSRASGRVDSFHRELGQLMWDHCGMARNEDGPADGADRKIPALREEFWKNVSVPGTARS